CCVSDLDVSLAVPAPAEGFGGGVQLLAVDRLGWRVAVKALLVEPRHRHRHEALALVAVFSDSLGPLAGGVDDGLGLDAASQQLEPRLAGLALGLVASPRWLDEPELLEHLVGWRQA